MFAREREKENIALEHQYQQEANQVNRQTFYYLPIIDSIFLSCFDREREREGKWMIEAGWMSTEIFIDLSGEGEISFIDDEVMRIQKR